MKRVFISLSFGLLLSQNIVAAPPLPPGSVDPGVQLNRDRDFLQTQELMRSINELKEKNQNEIINKQETQQPSEGMEEIKFVLKNINFSESEILSEKELSEISGQYIGKEITIRQLNDLVADVNKLYAKKGYLVCRAVLPEQAIQNGVVRVVLVEGKTGSVSIEGNHSTRDAYIKKRALLI